MNYSFLVLRPHGRHEHGLDVVDRKEVYPGRSVYADEETRPGCGSGGRAMPGYHAKGGGACKLGGVITRRFRDESAFLDGAGLTGCKA